MNLPAARSDNPRPEVERFRAAIARHMGLHFDDAKLDLLGAVLQRRCGRSGSIAAYLARLEDCSCPSELGALARELTVGETYFFRHNDQFRALAEVALPDRMRARDCVKTLRLLSAGCASGEEAYSLAIVAQEVVADPAWAIAIRAIDLNPAVLEKAARARYTPWALREAPAAVRVRCFRSEGRDLILAPAIRDAVQFAQGNLAADDPELWQPGAYDVIFCRNVLMYFAPEQMRAAVARLTAALAPGGYLFLGHAESLSGIGEQFQLCHTHETFYYRRKADASPARPRARSDASFAALRPSAAPLPMAPLSTAWVDAIRQASERVTALLAAAPADDRPVPPRAKSWELTPAFELLRKERFAEALEHVCSAPTDVEDDPDLLLVKAVLLVQAGQVAGAQEACRRLLAIDARNAGAHYVLALCREHAGELACAMEHDRLAAQLDPAFAMPRLHCGLLARRAGDRQGARDELAQAMVLLEREEASRLMLFGGGFSRHGLIALCRSAATESGERP